MVWVLEQTNSFEKEFNTIIPISLQQTIKKQLLHIQENPFVGKPLGFKFFREKNFHNWRVYFIIYVDKSIIYFYDFCS